MADNIQTEKKEERSLAQSLVEASVKEQEKVVKERTRAGLESGQSPQQILQSLVQTIGQGQQQANLENTLQEINQLAQQPVSTGERRNPVASLFGGRGFQFTDITQPRGTTEAVNILKLQDQREKDQRAILKQLIDTGQSVQQFQADLPSLQREKLQQEIQRGSPAGIEQAEVSKARGQARAQEEKKAAEFKRNFKIAEGKLKLTLKKFDEVVTETERISNLPAGRLGGFATTTLGKLGINKKVAAFKGQLVETSTAIAKIAAPSAKVGPDLIKLFSGTLPNNFSNLAEAKDQILTSITNAFVNFAATHPEDFPEGIDTDTFGSQMSSVLDKIIEKQSNIKSQEQTTEFNLINVLEGL